MTTSPFRRNDEGPHLTFHGDQTDALSLRMFPDGAAGWNIVKSSSYDPLLNITDAWLRPANPTEAASVEMDDDGNFYLGLGDDAA